SDALVLCPLPLGGTACLSFTPCLVQSSLRSGGLANISTNVRFQRHSAEIGLFCILNSNFFFIGIGIPLGSSLPDPLYGSKADVVTLCQAFLRIAQFYSLPVQLFLRHNAASRFFPLNRECHWISRTSSNSRLCSTYCRV